MANINSEEITESIAYAGGIRNFKRFLHRHHCFILSTHVNPDGDGLGAELALNDFLNTYGKKSYILNEAETPARYRFMDIDQEIHSLGEGKLNPKLLKKCAMIILDANHLERTGKVGEILTPYIKEIFYIDHHISENSHQDNYFNLVQATSTGEIVYYIIRNMGNGLNYKIAQALYTSILTDTGSFRFPKTDWKTHRIVTELLKVGINPSSVYQEVYENSSLGRIKLLRSFLNKLSFEFSGKLAFSYITDAMLEEAESSNEETDGFVNMPLEGASVRVSVLVKAYKDNVKVALRSKGAIDVSSIAKEFGGGGHFNASGFRLPDKNPEDLHEIKKIILEKLAPILN